MVTFRIICASENHVKIEVCRVECVKCLWIDFGRVEPVKYQWIDVRTIGVCKVFMDLMLEQWNV